LHRPEFRFIFGVSSNPILVNPPTTEEWAALKSHFVTSKTGRGGQPQTLRPLKSPSPIRVRTDDEGLPAELHQKGKRLRVLAVRERWRIDDEWWRDPISREYYALVLEDGRPVVLFRDLVAGGWYGQ